VRRIVTCTVLAVAALCVTPALTGCSSVSTALDCADTALTVTRAVNDLQQAVSDAPDDPQQAQQALNRIENDLDTLQDSTGDPDVSRAVRDLDKAAADARQALDEGHTPDLGPVGDAADELSAVCTPA
jgi:hypothetical protein